MIPVTYAFVTSFDLETGVDLGFPKETAIESDLMTLIALVTVRDVMVVSLLQGTF